MAETHKLDLRRESAWLAPTLCGWHLPWNRVSNWWRNVTCTKCRRKAPLEWQRKWETER